MTRMIPGALKAIFRGRGVIPRVRTWTGAAMLLLLAVASADGQSQFRFDANGNLLVQKSATSGPPLILGQPQRQVVAPDQTASFFVTAADPRGLSYQWRFNGTNLPAASADLLVMSKATAANEGAYDVVLANSFGSVTSSPAMLWIDTDDDGLPDSWEIAHFGNLSQTATGDFDHDGISNLQEFIDGSNPADGASAVFRLTVSQDGGTVQVFPLLDTYTNGQTVTLTAIPIAPETFHLWTGDILTQSNSTTVVMNANKTVFAHFSPFTFTWINAAGGDWNVPANWAPALVPGPDDNVVITAAATVSLNNDAACANLILGTVGSAPTLTGSATLSVHGNCTWAAGAMSGSGRTVIETGGTLTLDSSSSVSLATRTLENGGTILWTGAADFYPAGGALITNRAGALFEVQGSAAIRGSPGVVSRIDNAGTFRKSGSAGTTAIGPYYPVLFNNYGTVDIQSGGLAFSDGANNGDIAVPINTTLYLGGAFTSSAASTITGAGNLTFNGGFIDLGGLVNVSGPMTITGNAPTVNFSGTVLCTNNTLSIDTGTVTFNGTGAVTPTIVNLTGGTIGGSMVMTVGTNMNWTGGAMNGSGQTVIAPGASLIISGANPVSLTTRTLENGGTTLWTGSADFYPAAGAVITNRAGAMFEVQGSAAIRGSPGVVPRIDNAGTFRKSVSVGTTVIGPFYPVLFNNYGTVDIQSGILAANSGYFCTSDSALNCALWGTTAGATYGQLQVSGTVNLNGTLSVNLTNSYIPATNDTFVVVSAGTRSGTFANFLYPSNNVALSLSNAATAVVLRVTGVAPQKPVPVPMPSGIVSWWRAENDALDAVGTNHGMLTNGATFATGEVGNSFLLDGTNDYVVIADSPSLRPTSVTLEAWVKIFSTNGTQLIFAKPIGSGTLDSYGLALVNGAPLAAICDANGFGAFISASTPLTIGQWYHLAYSYDGNTRQEALYVNGAIGAAADAGKTMAFDSHPLLLGADIENGVPNLFLNGQIDEASLYSRALAPAEIASIYNVGSSGKQLVSVVPPLLYVEQIAPAIARFYWSTNDSEYHLEESATLVVPSWARSSVTLAIINGNYEVTNSLAGVQRYYRLSRLP
jgi:hypothetical protein